MLAEQIGDAIARGGGRDAGRELPAQLHADRTGQHAADQDDRAARGVIIDAGLGRAAARGMEEHRHVEQLGRRDEAGEGREPEVEPQRRQDDEDEIDQRRHEAERLLRPHAVDVQRQHDGRQRRLDQHADVAPDHRQVAPLAHVPADRPVHPELEQDQRNGDVEDVDGAEVAVPDAADHVGRKEIHQQTDRSEGSGGADQHLDAEQLGGHHLVHQGVMEVRRDRRACLVWKFRQSLTPVIPGREANPNSHLRIVEARDSLVRNCVP
ncbi:hypothetical protein ACVL91_001561 [Bradyrhizobium elkanii]